MVSSFPPTRPVNDQDRNAITKPVTDGLQDLIFGSPGLFEDRPGFIAGPPSGNPFVDAVRSISQANCRIWAGRDKTGYSTAVNAGNAELCRPYLVDIGEWPGDGDVGPEFEGGQCAAVQYDVVVQWTNFNNQTETIGRSGFGPIAGFALGSPFNGLQNLFVRFKLADGVTENLVIVNIVSTSIPPRPSFLSISRQDAQPDNCGDPDPGIVPPPVGPTPQPNPLPIVIGVPGFGPINVNVDVGPDGRPIIDFGDIGGPITISPPADGGGGGGSGDGESTPGAAGNGGDTGSGGDAAGEAGEGEELVGVLVQVLETPENPNTFDNNSEVVYRGIGYVRMGYPGRLGVDISGGTVLGTQFFHAQQRGLTSWAVNANLGYNLRVTPYYRSPES